ncbi:MAG: Na+/H+ antiporter [Nevskiaceae bacterium]|jgi:CPA1 family monovalent cation:H+ antiporter|nr:Na+/H+ antiporter [Nevskiaceae bacterium]
MATLEIVLAMLGSVVVSGLLMRALPIAIPLPLLQIGLGALIATFTAGAVKLDPAIFFLLFLPPLLFLDGWRVPNEGLLRDRGMILALALGLVVCTVLGMGLFIHWMIPAMTMPASFALAAIISPTDPVAVSAITNRTAFPPRMQHVLEGESLLNDASGLVCFRFAVTAAMTGTFSLSAAALSFVHLAVAGVVVGVALTFGILWLKNQLSRRFGEESGSQVLLSLLIPFAAYMVAEQIGGSGILAAVAAGITMSYMELTGAALGHTRMQRAAVWDTVQFALNGVMFVLLGEQLPSILRSSVHVVREAGHHDPLWLIIYILAINAGLIALRFVWVWVSLRVGQLLADTKPGATAPRSSARRIAAMSLAGVRGTITMAGVLTLPLLLPGGAPFPARDLTIFLASGTIILSLLTANVFLPRLLRGIEIHETRRIKTLDHIRVIAAEAAIKAIQQQLESGLGDPQDPDLHAEAVARVIEIYRRRIDGSSDTGETAVRLRRSDEIERQLRLTGLRAERDTVFAMARAQQMSDEVSRHLVREIDLMEERLS